jgi:hypothetical protein
MSWVKNCPSDFRIALEGSMKTGGDKRSLFGLPNRHWSVSKPEERLEADA